MGIHQMLGRTILKSLAIQLLLVSYCAAQTADPGPLRVGDRWSYDIKDEVTGDLRNAVTFVVAEITQKEITARVSVRGRDRPGTVVYATDWGRIDDGAWKYQPGEIGIRQPLQVGKEWRSEGNATNIQSGVALRLSGAAKVVGQEQVTTPAGTFDTFRIEMTVRQINTKDQTKSSTATHVTWYAPAINRWVRKKTDVRSEGRLRDSFSEELTEYSRRP
jgi:hypothetical protein